MQMQISVHLSVLKWYSLFFLIPLKCSQLKQQSNSQLYVFNIAFQLCCFSFTTMASTGSTNTLPSRTIRSRCAVVSTVKIVCHDLVQVAENCCKAPTPHKSAGYFIQQEVYDSHISKSSSLHSATSPSTFIGFFGCRHCIRGRYLHLNINGQLTE